jgi:hypothetical protein
MNVVLGSRLFVRSFTCAWGPANLHSSICDGCLTPRYCSMLRLGRSNSQAPQARINLLNDGLYTLFTRGATVHQCVPVHVIGDSLYG